MPKNSPQRHGQGGESENGADSASCAVEALLTIDSRGQLVLPKELREKAGIGAGDKLAVMSCTEQGRICCVILVRAEEVAGMIKGRLGPAINQIMNRR